VKRARFRSTHQGFKQCPGGDSKGQMVQIGSFPTGKGADLLKITETGLGEAKVIQTDR
tara:strand:- start:230 stop:403 length:174 start_codon:yes stop_codon:yes gene_type:complete